MDMLNRLLESGAKPDSDIISFLLNDDNSNWGMQYYFTPQILKKLEKYDGKQNDFMFFFPFVIFGIVSCWLSSSCLLLYHI